jgi:hypothetical protein
MFSSPYRFFIIKSLVFSILSCSTQLSIIKINVKACFLYKKLKSKKLKSRTNSVFDWNSQHFLVIYPFFDLAVHNFLLIK